VGSVALTAAIVRAKAREFGGGGITDAVVLNAFPPDPPYPTR